MKTLEEKRKAAPCGNQELPGWAAIIKEIDEYLCTLDPNYTVEQVKEKFGTLRFYYRLTAEDITEDRMDIAQNVMALENQTATICQECGCDSKIQTRGHGWVTTMCDDCWAKLSN